ncbi:3'-5' exonuclease [uncultured Fibrobacter sp.]|uniref:3'-5' exonuclease n=1 Tax=uncultured Fibrobacter sp. TaxID=261512 RepID=UPI0025F2AF42|nr:3'-5' exonuclease [uncultured Fibrobacter sp.]
MRFAVVDVESTGGAGEMNRITEVGIALVDDTEIVETFHTLVDPGAPISPFVQKLTGITDEMVQGAPQFQKIAEKVDELLRDRIFVAHNVQFDLKMMRTELKRCCISFDPPRLCTVKLARRVFPGFSSYSLHNLTESLGLSDFHHHRAMDDTLACAEILKLAYNKVGPEKILKEVKNLSTPKKARVLSPKDQ